MNNNSPIQENILGRNFYNKTIIWEDRVYSIETFSLTLEDGGGWVAEVPSLGKNTFCATDDTELEAIENLNELKDILESMFNKGTIIKK